MKIETYLNEITPNKILDVVEKGVLQNLLNGYSYALGSGMAVLYPVVLPVTLSCLDRADALEEEAELGFHPLCRLWREKTGCNQAQRCLDADKQVVLKYYGGEWTGLRIYRCQPMGLWDMSYSLIIEGRIVGVLFGGQIIVEGMAVDWHSELKEFLSFIDWNTVPRGRTHAESVRLKIRAQRLPESDETKLINVFDDRSKREREVLITMEEFKERIRDFQKFGEIMQGLLVMLHAARKTAAEQQIVRDLDKELDKIDLSDAAKWWVRCGRLLHELTSLWETSDACLFVREGSRYVTKVNWATDEKMQEGLRTRDVISGFPKNRLHLASIKDNPRLLKDSQLTQTTIWGYRSENATGAEICSTLVLFLGEIPEFRRQLLDSLCAQLCTASDFAALLFRERESDIQFRRKVDRIAHAARTPLEALQLTVDTLKKLLGNNVGANLLDDIDNVIARIKGTREDLTQLIDPALQEVADVDVIELLISLIEEMQPIAQNHPCIIKKEGVWPKRVHVRANRIRLKHALRSLLDNAIKYSYKGIRPETNSYFEVRIQIVLDKSYINIMMRNYGIGIPKEKMNAIREYGKRAEIEDRKTVRLGTGIGLPTAIDTFEELGGSIEITSNPAPRATEEERKTYHRYVTTVEAALPILEGK